MDQDEFIGRYVARLRERVPSLTEEMAQATADAIPFAEMSDGFEDDPEGAADEELSYWDYDDEEPAEDDG